MSHLVNIEVDAYLHHIIQSELQQQIIPHCIYQVISSYYNPWCQLQLAPKTEHRYPNLVHYFAQKEAKEYIILAPFIEDSQHCYKYDIKQNKWIPFTSYPVQSACHSLAVDQHNDLLYISHGHHRIFAVYNFIDNQWNTICHGISESVAYNVEQYIANAASLVLPNGEFHLFCNILTNSAHIKWDVNQNKFVRASTNGIRNNCYLFETSLIFVKGRNILLALGGYLSDGETQGNTDGIWYTEYNQNDKTAKYEWKEFELKLPINTLRISCVVAFDFVLIISDRQSVWILDLDETGCKQWKEPIVKSDQYPKGCKLVLTNGNYLHFINCYKENAHHCNIHLSRFIPTEIYLKYQNS